MTSRTDDDEWEAITAAIDHDGETDFRFGESASTCPTCQGSGEGQFEGTRCWACNRRGEVFGEKTA